jgi:hypothetical protein
MELSLTFAVTGFILLLASGIRLRKYLPYKNFQEQLKNRVNTEKLDFSGKTNYSRCYSHHWLRENVMLRKHGKLGRWFQSYMMYNTLSATMLLAFIGIFVLVIYVIFIHAIMVIGFAVGIFFVGILLLVGPSTPHISNLLLAELIAADIDDLNEEDYVYVKLANDSILQWVFVLNFFGFGFIFLAPWGDIIPLLLASLIITFTEFFVMIPARIIAEFSLPFAIIYIASILPILIICLIKSIQIFRKRIFSKEKSIIQEM